MAEGNGNGYSRWQLWVSIAALGAVVFSAIVGLSWAANSAYGKAMELQGRLDRMEETVSANRAQFAQVCSALVEIETQFRASDQVRNLMHTNDLRIQAMLWRKSFGEEYPVGDPYLPTIAQDQPSPCR